MGFADSPATVNTLASHGIRVDGYRWRWALGLKGGTFPPHREQNNEFASNVGEFPALPGEDVNSSSCMCALVPVYRGPDGRFAKPGLQPVFQPPVTASALELYRPEPLDLSPLVAAITDQPIQVNVTVPPDAIRVTVNIPDVIVPETVVNVSPTPVSVESPQIRVDAPTVTVEAPNVTVSPNIDVKPSPVKIIRERVGAKSVRFRRNNTGLIESAEVIDNG